MIKVFQLSGGKIDCVLFNFKRSLAVVININETLTVLWKLSSINSLRLAVDLL